MLSYIIPLYASYMPMFDYVMNYFFALAFLATFPYIVKSFFRR